MYKLRHDEFSALRSTIRERGTVRVITFLATLIAWAALVLVFEISSPRNIVGSLLSLMVLVAGFEVVFQLHLGVERVGRYLQVAYEQGAEQLTGGPRWETTAMVYGRSYPAAGSDALFSGMFVLATLVNMLPVLEAVRVPIPFAFLAAAHLAFVVRVRVAKYIAGVQRAQDLERFKELLTARPNGAVSDPGAPNGESPAAEPAETPRH